MTLGLPSWLALLQALTLVASPRLGLRQKLHVLMSIPRFVEGFPFEFEPRSKLVLEMGSFTEGSKNPTT